MKHRLWSTIVLLLLVGCKWEMGTVDMSPPQVETGVDPNAWATIPTGSFLYGQHNKETLVDYDYEMMITDVTNGQYASYLNEALAAGWVVIGLDALLLGGQRAARPGMVRGVGSALGGLG